jgi:hypothetical protein
VNRRPAVLLCLLAALLAFPAAAGAAAGDPTYRPRKADQALAAKMLLKKTDLPSGGWSASPTDFSQTNPPCIVQHFNLSDLTATGRAGLDYRRGTALIESEAYVFVSRAQVLKAWARTGHNRAYLKCIAAFLAKGIQVPGAQTVVSFSTYRKIPKIGDASDSFRIGLSLRGGGRRVPFYIDVVSARKGRAEADVIVFSISTAPSVALEERLLRKMVGRVPG